MEIVSLFFFFFVYESPNASQELGLQQEKLKHPTKADPWHLVGSGKSPK